MRAAVAFLALLLGVATGTPALSQPESPVRLLRARGVVVAYDATSGSVSVKERGRVRSYFLLAGGAAGDTEVVIESAPARASDLRPGAPVLVSWRPDDRDRTRRVAHKVEVPVIPKSHRGDLR